MRFTKSDFNRKLEEQGVRLTQRQINQFAIYAQMLITWNQKMNLTAITNLDEIYEKHFYDSLLIGFDEELSGKICDVGAGAGFPSIPLKIVFPHLQVTIVEALQKRVTFLNALKEALDIEVTCVHSRSEDFAKDHREEFDIVCARAVANLQVLSELCIPLVKQNGVFIACKGSKALQELANSEHAIATLGCRLKKQARHVLSNDAIRINFYFTKIKESGGMYPRSYATIKKHPL